MKRVKCREENPGDSWQEVYARFYQESVERTILVTVGRRFRQDFTNKDENEF